MTKTAFLFPGQGSQFVGMGKDLYDSHPEARAVFDAADEALGRPLSRLCFEGPEDELRLTVNTQPALFTTSVAVLKCLQAKGFQPDVVAGHSVGEYAALVASGSLDFEDGIKLVNQRSLLMQAAAEAHPGSMAAVIGLDTDQVREACKRAESDGVIDVANYNSPGQVVISGESKAVEAASAYAKEAGARMVVALNVSGGFHSRLMASAAEGIGKFLSDVPFREASIPVIANVTADYTRSPEMIRAALERQLVGSVRWEETLMLMSRDGVDCFVEVGPGKVLAGLVKRTVKGAEIHSVGDAETLEAFAGGRKETI
jgi:[acyl-carrier-protein] S-malonyltransferase